MLLNALNSIALPLKFVDTTCHTKAIMKGLLCYDALTGLWVLKHTSQESCLVKLALFDLLKIEILL